MEKVKKVINFPIVFYPTADEILREKLFPFKLEYGFFRRALTEKPIYDTLQVLVAHGPRGGIWGWAGIYDPNPYRNEPGGENFYSKRNINTMIGVFVDPKRRGQGIGGRLKEEAIKVCISQGKSYGWQDRKDNGKFVKFDLATGKEERF